MRFTLSDKIIAYLALLSGLTISAVAIWYSVAGLVSIFAAAVIPIIVMGVALEISKLIATVWLKLNWNRAPVFIRSYLLVAIAILMVITSMGIFGFLSKAHSDQSLVSGDVQAKIAVYDEKIKTAKDNIDANRKALKQLDEAVDQVMGRSNDEKGAEKAVSIRRSQQKERARLQAEIQADQKAIGSLNEERAPIAAEVRKVEAEVGPIKYIAAFVYGDNPDANVLEKAVTWVIIIIVSVFDPLAVILLLASQYSFQWFRKQEEEQEEEQEAEGDSPEKESDDIVDSTATVTEPDLAAEANALIAEIEPEVPEFIPPVVEEEKKPEVDYSKHTYLTEPFKHFENLKPMVAQVEDFVDEELEQKVIDDAPHSEKEAMAKWKAANPDSSLKLQRRLFERGSIAELPWMQYIEAKPDYVEEAEKWAEENPTTEAAQVTKDWAAEQIPDMERPGDYVTPPDLSYMENIDGHQIKKTIEGYTQNAEQSDSTLWQKVKKTKE